MNTNLLLVKNGFLMLFLFFTFASNAQNSTQSKINITSFQLAKDQNKVVIKWSTDSASATNYFVVEKSSDGKNFKSVAYVFGAEPTQKDCDCFDCFDEISGNAKTSYYRLKHVNANGIIQFSEVKMLALK